MPFNSIIFYLLGTKDIPVEPIDHVAHLVPIFGYGLFAFFLFIFLQPFFYSLLLKYKLSKTIREEAASGGIAKVFRSLHEKKQGVPTMGGILIWLVVLVTVLFSRYLSYEGIIEKSVLSRGEVYLPLFTLVSMGLLGAIDDWFNIRGIGKKRGIDVTPKFFLLTFFAGVGAWWFYSIGYDTINIPLIGEFFINGWYIPLFVLVIVGTANAVNITDGLDGLASGLLIIAFISFGGIAYAHEKFFLATFCGIISCSLIGFLWYNVPPAKFFMGDTGSLALGATLGVIAMMMGSLVVLPLIGGVFVIETLSVILQVSSKKLRKGKKIFNIAPLHHHFESLGWGEAKVVMRLWTIGGFLAMLGLIIELVGLKY